MMKKALLLMAFAGIATFTTLSAAAQSFAPGEKEQLLSVREAVWRAWFAGDQATLERLVPPDTITINAGEEKLHSQKDELEASAQFHAAGGKLIRLEFPRTEIQRYGDVAITYSQYLYEIEMDGKRSVASGRATEIFVLRDGKWTNPGWHTDRDK